MVCWSIFGDTVQALSSRRYLRNMSKITPELRLKKLRRLEHNIVCPNCGTAAPQGLGFGSVCVKFNTFICDLCE